MSIVKISHILPKWKNAPPIFLYVVQYMANYQKINRKLKKYWGKLTYFWLGPKTWNGHWDPHFALRSKIHVFCSTFPWEVLVFGAKQELGLEKFMPWFCRSYKSVLLRTVSKYQMYLFQEYDDVFLVSLCSSTAE